MIEKILKHKFKILSALTLCCLICFCYIVSNNITHEITPEDTPLSESNTEAMFYVENPESGSVTCIGDGLIKSGEEITNDKEETADAVVTAPDYSAIVGNQLIIAWHTIKHEDGEYKVYGTLTTAAAQKAEEAVTSLTVSTFNDIQTAKVDEDGTITTLGFYEENDGGGAEYVVSSEALSEGIINASVPMDNGFFANLVYTDSVNVKQIGAHGDGSSNDSSYFNSVLNTGLALGIPDGTYEMGSSNLKATSPVTMTGIDGANPIIKNATIIAPYGISLTNLTLDGGNKQALYLEGRAKNIGNFLCLVTPDTAASISYKNCTFQNADFGSFAMVSDKEPARYFTSDSATGCTFKDLQFIGVYHCVYADNTYYDSNLFENIGSDSISTGTIGALKIGDSTNITKMGSRNCTISNNTFKSLYSADDFDRTKHAINCNFLTVMGEKATIKGNKIYNMYGYGDDREAIYTKVRRCTIDNNYIYNGGTGEGYICNKGSTESDALCIITNNTFEGEYGTAIQNYGAAIIRGNHINMTKLLRGIGAMGRKSNINDLVIEDNDVNASAGYYYNNGERLSSYSPSYVIHTEEYTTPVSIKNNNIHIESVDETPMKAVFRVGAVRDDFVIENNIADSTDVPKCAGIEITAKQEHEDYHKDSDYHILNNELDIAGTPINITVNGEDPDTSREFKIEDNNITSSKTVGYAVTVTDSKNNNDEIYFNDNDLNVNYTKKVLYSTVKTMK